MIDLTEPTPMQLLLWKLDHYISSRVSRTGKEYEFGYSHALSVNEAANYHKRWVESLTKQFSQLPDEDKNLDIIKTAYIEYQRNRKIEYLEEMAKGKNGMYGGRPYPFEEALFADQNSMLPHIEKNFETAMNIIFGVEQGNSSDPKRGNDEWFDPVGDRLQSKDLGC